MASLSSSLRVRSAEHQRFINVAFSQLLAAGGVPNVDLKRLQIDLGDTHLENTERTWQEVKQICKVICDAVHERRDHASRINNEGDRSVGRIIDLTSQSPCSSALSSPPSSASALSSPPSISALSSPRYPSAGRLLSLKLPGPILGPKEDTVMSDALLSASRQTTPLLVDASTSVRSRNDNGMANSVTRAESGQVEGEVPEFSEVLSPLTPSTSSSCLELDSEEERFILEQASYLLEVRQPEPSTSFATKNKLRTRNGALKTSSSNVPAAKKQTRSPVHTDRNDRGVPDKVMPKSTQRQSKKASNFFLRDYDAELDEQLQQLPRTKARPSDALLTNAERIRLIMSEIGPSVFDRGNFDPDGLDEDPSEASATEDSPVSPAPHINKKSRTTYSKASKKGKEVQVWEDDEADDDFRPSDDVVASPSRTNRPRRSTGKTKPNYALPPQKLELASSDVASDENMPPEQAVSGGNSAKRTAGPSKSHMKKTTNKQHRKTSGSGKHHSTDTVEETAASGI